MKGTLLLADAAEESNGKLFILGGGWSVTKGPGPISMALALKIEVPWNEANRKHPFLAELLTEDGHPAVPIGSPQPLKVDGHLEVGRPAGLPPGTALDAPLALTLTGVQLEPGGYRWQVKVGDEIVATASFLVMPPEPIAQK